MRVLLELLTIDLSYGRLQIGEILPFLRDILNSQNHNSELNLPPEIPFTGGWLGWLGYDLAWEIEKLPQLNQDALPFPVSCWYEPESFAVLDHHTANSLAGCNSSRSELDIMQHQLAPKIDLEIIPRRAVSKTISQEWRILLIFQLIAK